MKNLILAVVVAICSPVLANDKILESINKDDLSLYQQATNKAYSINHLTQSINLQSENIFDFLIKTLPDLNTYDSSGNTPVLQAAMANQYSYVESLLNKGVNPNLQGKSGLEATPLMYAAAFNNTEMIKALLKYQANINQVDVNQDHALNWATYYGHLQAMELLMQQGADVTLKSKHGQAVDVGFRLWHADSVTSLFKKYMKFEPLPAKSKKIIQAIRTNDLYQAEKLLEKIDQSGLVDELGSPMINLAIEKGYTDMVQLMVRKGANVDQLNRVGQAPLAIAARFGRVEIVKMLIDAGADVNHTDNHYRLTPLIGAAVNGNVAIGKVLIDEGALLNHTDSINGGAALHWALFYKNSDFAVMTVENGADYNSNILDGTYSGKSLAKAYENQAVLSAIELEEVKRNTLFGSWQMSEIHYVYADTTYKVVLNYPGRLLIGPNRYAIMYNPYGSDRKAAANISKLTNDEMLYAFKTLAFNTGTYTISDDVLATKADIAKVAGFEGGQQIYAIEKKGDELQLTMFDETYPDGNKPEWYGKLKILFKLKKEWE
ncbi:MAG: ankyrin repeat domain-containing protein [Fulvivirga sp.]